MAKRNRRGMGSVRWREDTKKSEDFVFSGLNSNAMARTKKKGLRANRNPLICLVAGARFELATFGL